MHVNARSETPDQRLSLDRTEGNDYQTALRMLADLDERLIVMTAENRAAIRDLPALLDRRFIDVGIAEQTMIGMAAGMALRGRIVVAHALATFLTLRAFEFIRTDIGISALPVKLVGSFAGFQSEANGPTHQALEDVALMRGIPNINVWCPADRQDLLLGLARIIADPSPYYIRYNASEPVIEHLSGFEPGIAEVVCKGDDITLLTYGTLFGVCHATALLLRKRGFSVGLINMRTLKPLDTECIVATALSSQMLVTVEDHFLTGGLYSLVAETLFAAHILARVMPLALKARWFKPALYQDVLTYEGFTPLQMTELIQARFLGQPCI